MSIPGAITFSSFNPSRRFCRSEWIASAIPGYWTLTATARPSCSAARCTCPIDAAAIGSGSNSSNTSLSFSPRSSSTTFAIALNDTGSALCWSVARISWNSGRISSGTSPRSTAESVCPTFIAAPRMPLNTFTSDLALFSCWRRGRRGSDEPDAVNARAVASRAATPAAAPVSCAARRIRDPLISSFA